MTIREISPHLCVKDAAKAIAFYEAAFGARERFRLTEPGGRLGHAEMDFDGSVLMLADEYPELGFVAPSGATASATLYVQVTDADAAMARAVDAGATVLRPLQDEFYGERTGTIQDPFGHRWHLAQRVEEMSVAEMQARYNALMAGA